MEWSDKINSVKVYVFGDGDKLEKVVTLSNLSLDQRTTGTVKVSSNEAFKVKAGTKKVYVVVNPTDAVTLPEAVGTTELTAFTDAYDKVNKPTAPAPGADDPYYPKAPVTETRADKFASVSGQEDVILMTGEMGSVEVKNGVTEQEAVSGVANQAHLKVERAVARVVVTSKEGAAFEIKGDDPMTEAKDETVLATLTNITYTVAQSERAFNFIKKENGTEGASQLVRVNPYEVKCLTALIKLSCLTLYTTFIGVLHASRVNISKTIGTEIEIRSRCERFLAQLTFRVNIHLRSEDTTHEDVSSVRLTIVGSVSRCTIQVSSRQDENTVVTTSLSSDVTSYLSNFFVILVYAINESSARLNRACSLPKTRVVIVLNKSLIFRNCSS